MGRPRKTLYQFAIRDRTFLARRHAHLLEEEPLLDRPQRLRELQQAYRAEVSRLERAAIARQFERAVRQTPADLDAEALAEAFSLKEAVASRVTFGGSGLSPVAPFQRVGVL